MIENVELGRKLRVGEVKRPRGGPLLATPGKLPMKFLEAPRDTNTHIARWWKLACSQPL